MDSFMPDELSKSPQQTAQNAGLIRFDTIGKSTGKSTNGSVRDVDVSKLRTLWVI
jgi:hypothetical protein